MAISITAVTATQATASSGVANSTTSFSPGAGSLVRVCFTYMLTTNTTGITFTVKDSNSTSYSQVAFEPTAVGALYAGVYEHQYASAPGSITVTVTASSTVAADCLIQPYTITGQALSQSGAGTGVSTSGSSSTTCECSVTTTAVGSVVVIAGGWVAGSAPTGVNTTTDATWNDNAVTGGEASSGHSSSATVTPGATTFGWTLSPASSFGYVIAAAEVLPATGGQPDVPAIRPSPIWLDHFKPGLAKPRPFTPDSTALEQGPLNVTLPGPVTSLSGTLVRPQDVPAINPGPVWFMRAKPGIARPHPQPVGFELSGENGPLNVTLPAPSVSLTGNVVRPQDVPQIAPGPAWFRNFKPGMPRPRPVTPTSSVIAAAGALNVTLPAPFTSLSGVHVHSPENLGAVLTEQTPDAVTTEATPDATFTLADYGATLVLADLGATLTGWTMQTAPLNLNEFNDVSISIAVTSNGSPLNLTGATLNLLLKTKAGTPDANALTFSSGGGSPAITITNAASGLATCLIPAADLSAETYFFYRLDVVSSGLTNTALYGPITWTTL